MTEQAIDQRAAFEGAIRQMAATNPAFRAELSSNPTEALKAAFGLDLPADFNLRVVNEKPGELVLVLPSPVRELNDDELDVVSGAGLSTFSTRLAEPPRTACRRSLDPNKRAAVR